MDSLAFPFSGVIRLRLSACLHYTTGQTPRTMPLSIVSPFRGQGGYALRRFARRARSSSAPALNAINASTASSGKPSPVGGTTG